MLINGRKKYAGKGCIDDMAGAFFLFNDQIGEKV